MDRMIYINAVGLRNIEQAQTAHANNLANVNTHGFRRDFASALATEVQGDGYRNRVYGVTAMPGVDMSQGTHVDTGRSLDVAINGAGLFALQLPDGGEVYSRHGGFVIDDAGRLLNEQGLAVMGRGGPIAIPPYESLTFGADGTITIRPQGQGAEALVQIDRLKLVDIPGGEAQKNVSGFIVAKVPENVALKDDAVVKSGFLETSNVNPVHEMTEILALARQFELEVKMLQTAQSNDEAAAQLLRIG